MPAATSRTGGSTAARSRRSSARAAARARGRSRPTTRTPRRWASRRPGSRCAARATAPSPTRCGSPPRTRRTSTRRTPPTIHAALRLDRDVAGARLRRRGPLRRRRAARRARRPTAPCSSSTSDLRAGLPTSADEAARRRRRRRAARRRRRRRPGDRRVPRRRQSATEEFIDRWRTPGRRRARAVGGALRRDQVRAARRAGVERGARRPPSSRPSRSTRSSSPACTRVRCARSRGRLGVAKEAIVDDLAATVGNTGTAHAGAAAHERARDGASPGEVIALVVARRRRRRAGVPHDRRDRVVHAGALGRDAGRQRRRRSPTASSSSWRGMRHARAAAPARARPHLGVGRRAAREDWKYAFVGSRDRDSGALHLPPRACLARRRRGRRHGRRRRWRDVAGHDRDVHDRPHRVLAEPADRVRGRRLRRRRPPPGRAHRRRRRRRCKIGDRVEMTFRRLFTADGIHNYFWKARPVRGAVRQRSDAHGFARHQGPGRDRRHGLHAVRRALGQGHRRPAHRRRPSEAFASAGVDKDDVDAYWLGTAMSGMSGHGARPAAAAARQAGHPRRELLRDRRPRRCATPRTRSRAARTTSRWRSASRR